MVVNGWKGDLSETTKGLGKLNLLKFNNNELIIIYYIFVCNNYNPAQQTAIIHTFALNKN